MKASYYEVLYYPEPNSRNDFIDHQFKTRTEAMEFYNNVKNDKDKFDFWVTARNSRDEILEDIIL